MNETLILVWACIAIIGVIAIVIVKIYFKDKDSEEINFSDITTRNPLQEMISEKEKSDKNVKTERTNPISNYFSNDEPEITLRKEGTKADKEFNPYIVPERDINRNISYSSQNQVLINYDGAVEKFQEPITETQRDIMNKNKDNENPEVTFKKTTENKHELKDLFTIDELIKESKRKDDEREKESKIINKETEDNSDIKESIKKNQEAKNEESGETDITAIKSSIEKMHEIAEAIKTTKSEDLTPHSVASQKDIAEAIDSATKETKKEEVPEISESKSITDAVIKKEPEKEEIPESKSITDAVIKKEPEKEETTIQETLPVKEEVKEIPKEDKVESISEVIPEGNKIKTPTLKSPTKVEEDSISILPGADEDYEFGASIDSSNLFEDENGQLSDLDYRKDLARFTNTIKNSGIVKDIREKLASVPEEKEGLNEKFIRNVGSYTEDAYETYNDYDEWQPIINETHDDYLEPNPEEKLRQENTRKVFENAKNNISEPVSSSEEIIQTPKSKPEKSSLKIMINNNEEVLRKGDEIIYIHEGETYSSKVYSINGDDIKVKYRRQNITIKPSDIKKIY